MKKVAPEKVITEFVNKAFISVELPKSNNPALQSMLCDLYIANAMKSLGTAKQKKLVDDFKKTYKALLEKAEVNQPFEIDAAAPFSLMAKVSNPRESFDKDAFIKAVADKYDISAIELLDLAKETVKESAAPTSFEVVINSNEQSKDF